MKKSILLMAAALICGASVFTSCESVDNPATQSDQNLSEQIIGKWMVEELDGEPCPTNMKIVMTFVSPTLAYCSISDILSDSWADYSFATVDIKGDKMTLSAEEDSYSHKADVVITAITDEYMELTTDWTVFAEGQPVYHEAYGKEIWKRVTEDYDDEIIGTWEGKVTRDLGDAANDELHRWECKADGTYVFYSQVDGEWKAEPSFLADYFVDGTLLCTRWQDTADSEELREWWEISSIEDGVMKATALRVREDGTTYTATFEMTEVK